MADKHEQKGNPFKLPPLKRPSITCKEWLCSLKENPERADTAQALILRALEKMGVEKIEDEEDPERKQYLQMLASQGIPSFLAFKKVAGSQLFQMSIVFFLTAAAANGAQLNQIASVEGPPGSGKDLFKDGIIKALRTHGTVWAVKGCPDHENPLNLLKLDGVTQEKLEEIAEITGLGPKLFDMLKTASQPCQCCHKLVMGDLDKANEEPDFENVEVEEIRLSNYSGGIQEWKPGQNCSLEKALRKANRGFIALNDAWMKIELQQGKSEERLVLLDAPQYRRLSGIPNDGCIDPPADSPLDVFIMATTNAKAFEQFLASLPDKDAFTSRCVLLVLRYNTVRVEEIRAYREVIQNYREVAHYDPLALKLMATLAILSRLNVPKSDEVFVHPLDQMRLLQGEKIQVKPIQNSQTWNSLFSTTSSAYNYNSNPYAYSGGSSSSSTSSDKDVSPLKKDAEVRVSDLWRVSGGANGMSGLDMRFMLGLLSSTNQVAVSHPKHKCVSALDALKRLRASVMNKLNASNLTADQKTTYERCLKWLGGKGLPGAEIFGGKNPDLIELEYLRLLKEQIIRAFAPDYEQRAETLFQEYFLHAPAIDQNMQFVQDPERGKVPVNISLVDELDRLRLGKPKGASLSDEDKKFRGKLQALKAQLREEFARRNGEDALGDFKITWQTITDLQVAISKKLDEEVGLRIDKILTTEVVSDLSDEEQEQFDRAKAALTDLGYCDACSKPMLKYAKATKVWSFKGY